MAQTPTDLLNLKTVEQIVEDEINLSQAQTDKINDYNTGSVIRTIYEAVALTVKDCYDVLEQIFDHSYIGTADGYALDLKAGDIGIVRKAATVATTNLTFGRAVADSSNYLIPTGTRVCTEATSSSPEIIFETSEDGTLTAGNTSVVIPAQCISNFDEGESFASASVFITSAADGKNTLHFILPTGCAGRVYRGISADNLYKIADLAQNATTFVDYGQFEPGNEQPPIIGYDRLPFPTNVSLTTASGGSLPAGTYYYVITSVYPRGERGNVTAGTITKFISRPIGIETVNNVDPAIGGTAVEKDDEFRVRVPLYLANLARGTANALRYGALLVDGVYSVSVAENFPAEGHNTIYIDDGSGNATESLIASVVDEIENWRACGISALVTAPEVDEINVTCEIEVEQFHDSAYVLESVEIAIRDWLRAHITGEDVVLSKLIALVVGTEGVADVAFSAPTTNTSISTGHVARDGVITVTEAS